jgi:hypothetical protein
MTGAMAVSLNLLIGFCAGAAAGILFGYHQTTPVWKKGLKARYELGVAHGVELEAARQATDRYTRAMGRIHHPLGSPVRYSAVEDLMPRIVEEG